MDLIIVLVLIVLVAFFYKKFKFEVYFIGILEIFLRLINYIANHIEIDTVSTFVNKYIPSSLFNLIGKYSNGLLSTIFSWVLIAMLVLFEFYLIKNFIKKKS